MSLPAEIHAKNQDFTLISQAFGKLKEEYPELNHVRITANGDIVFDTKICTILRRVGYVVGLYF